MAKTATAKPKAGSNKSSSFEVGKNYLIRTVTHYYTGQLATVTDSDLVLTNAAWIPDTGRFSDCLQNSTVVECEPFVNPVIVSRGAIVDATLWGGQLPTVKK